MPCRFPWFLLLLLAGAVSAQSGLQPPFEIPSSIAKLPERSDFEGNWLRADGTYRMQIERSPEGEWEAAYFNPQPIHVESVGFDSEAEEPLLVVVLRDEGYPGSTYRLRYLPERGVLLGTYRRPGSAQAEVYFVPAPAAGGGGD